MNMKELEAALVALQEKVSEMRDHQDGQNDILHGVSDMPMALQNLTNRVDNVVEGFTAQLNGVAESLRKDMNGFGESLNNIRLRAEEVHTELLTRLNEREATIAMLVEKLEEIEPKVNSTNKSAPTKRNMTDEDALKVLTGDLKELSHKEAAEKIGLTYAQVYSARLEFTFKHVHKELRDSGWKNTFVKQ